MEDMGAKTYHVVDLRFHGSSSFLHSAHFGQTDGHRGSLGGVSPKHSNKAIRINYFEFLN